MDVYSLRFRDPSTERQYLCRLTRTVLLQSDVAFYSTFCVVAAAAGFRCVLNGSSWLAFLVSALASSHMWTELCVRRRESIHRLGRHRTKRVLVSRQVLKPSLQLAGKLFREYVLQLNMRSRWHTRELTEFWFFTGSALQNGRAILVLLHSLLCATDTVLESQSWFLVIARTGVFLNLFIAFNLRLPFRHHFPFQILSTVAMLLLSTRRPCHIVMKNDEVHWVMQCAHVMHKLAMFIMLVPGSQWNVEIEMPSMLCPCMHIACCLHVFVLTVLVPYVLWVMEHKSRMAFIRELSPCRIKSEGLLNIQPLPHWVFLRHFQILVMSFAILWRVSIPCIHFLEKWGLIFER